MKRYLCIVARDLPGLSKGTELVLPEHLIEGLVAAGDILPNPQLWPPGSKPEAEQDTRQMLPMPLPKKRREHTYLTK